MTTNLLNPGCGTCYSCSLPACTDCENAEQNYGLDINSLTFTGAEQAADGTLGGEDFFSALQRCGGSNPATPFSHTFGGWGAAGTLDDSPCRKQIGFEERDPIANNPTIRAYVQLNSGCDTGSGIAYEGDTGGWVSGYSVGYQTFCESGVPRLRLFGGISYGLAYVTANNQAPFNNFLETQVIDGVTWTFEASRRRTSNPFTYFYSRRFSIANVTSTTSIDFASQATGDDPLGFFHGVATLTL